MSEPTKNTSSELSIPFTLSHTPQSFRFLELPDELLGLITGGTVPTLHLKSSSQSSTSFFTEKERVTPRTKAAEFVHLCSEELEQTWTVRQVSTSNEVYLIQPTWLDNTDGEDTVMCGSGPQTTALTAIAKADSILELLPTSVDVENSLRRLLSTYNVEQFHAAQDYMGTHLNGEEFGQKERIFANIPAPNTMIQRVWREMCVSKLIPKRSDAPEKYFIPHSDLLMAAWNGAGKSFDMGGGGNKEMESQDFEGKHDGLDEFITVSEAIWRKLCSDGGSRLDREKTISWLGQTLLHEAMMKHTNKYSYEMGEFLEKWAEKIPRAWAADVDVGKMNAESYEIGTVDGIQMIGSMQKHLDSDLASAAATAKATSATGKRKWHEKFKEQRIVK